MQDQFSRTELLIGREAINKLNKARVSIFGLGGVGSFTAEALARVGIGKFDLIDFDDICLTNVNRQILALHSTLGEPKVEVMKERILDINPRAEVRTFKNFYTQEEADTFLSDEPDYVVDAIDTVKSKVSLAKECYQRKIPFVSSMGAGNRLNPYGFRAADISKTTGDPLAKAFRKLLKKEGITEGVKVIYSPDLPLQPILEVHDCHSSCICPGADGHCTKKRQIPGSVSFVPSVVGLLLASEVVNDLLRKKG